MKVSLRYKLQLLIAVPLGIGVVVIAAVAHSAIQNALLDAARTRLAGVSQQLVTSFEESATRLDREMRNVVADSSIRATFERPSDSTAIAAAKALLARGRAKSTQPVSFVVWSHEGQQIVADGPLLSPLVKVAPQFVRAIRVDTAPSALIIGPFVLTDSGVTYETNSPILSERRDTLGFLTAHRRIATSRTSVNTLTGIIGSEGRVLMGNADGSLWTDLVKPVKGPDSASVANANTRALVTYTDSTGTQMIAVAIPIRHTPWALAIAMPRASALAPASRFRLIIGGLALLVISIGCGAAWWLSRRVVDPVAEVSRAAADIASGDYNRRISLVQRDELGALVSSFNVMAARVQNASIVLETRNAEVQESEERYRQLVDRTPDAIVVHVDRRVVFANPAAVRLLGAQSQEQVLDHSLQEFAPLRASVGDNNSDVSALNASNPNTWSESTIQRIDGSSLTVERASLALQLDGREAVLTILRDISERKLLEDRLRQSQKMEAVGQLAGGVAHDFNNLLTVITSYSGVLLMDMAPDAPMRTEIEEISNAASRAGVLTRQLLAFSRQQVLQPQVLDLNEIVRSMEKMLGRVVPENIKFSTLLAHNIGRINADPGQLEQVLMNLVVNAQDAMPDGGKLLVETSRIELNEHDSATHAGAPAGLYTVLSVSDTGCGMTAQQQSRIFEPFYTTKGEGRGTGLGLSTVYGIVKQSNGHIWVYSELDRGTVFKVYLPIVDATIDRRTPVASPAQGARPGERVLLVEDGAQVRAVAREILARSGYIVIEAANGVEALTKLATLEGAVHVLLTDMVMPEMSGRDLATDFRAMHPDSPVLFMSGYTQDYARMQSLTDTNASFLQKPFSPQTLLEAVRTAIDHPLTVTQ